MPPGTKYDFKVTSQFASRTIVLPGKAYLFLVTQRMVLFAAANETLSLAMSIIRLHKDGYSLLQQ